MNWNPQNFLDAANDERRYPLKRAFAELWLALKKDSPNFILWEQIYDEDQAANDKFKKDVIDYLSDSPEADNPSLEELGRRPLAVLLAIGEYLKQNERPHDTNFCQVSIGSESCWVFSRSFPRPQTTKHLNQRGKMVGWLPHHWISKTQIDGICIYPQASRDREFQKKLMEIQDRGRIRIYWSTFFDNAGPSFDNTTHPGLFFAKHLDFEKRWLSIKNELEKAAESKADWLVFPELTIDEKIRNEIREWLYQADHSFSLILPGSFHFRNEGEDRHHNQAELWDGIGCAILAHNKLCPHTVIDAKGRYTERITPGREFPLLVFAFGVLGIPICLDFCEEKWLGKNPWDHVELDWALVPSMGRDTTVHACSRAEERLHRAHGTIPLVVVQPPPDWNGSDGPRNGHCCITLDSTRGKAIESAEERGYVDFPAPPP